MTSFSQSPAIRRLPAEDFSRQQMEIPEQLRVGPFGSSWQERNLEESSKKVETSIQRQPQVAFPRTNNGSTRPTDGSFDQQSTRAFVGARSNQASFSMPLVELGGSIPNNQQWKTSVSDTDGNTPGVLQQSFQAAKGIGLDSVEKVRRAAEGSPNPLATDSRFGSSTIQPRGNLKPPGGSISASTSGSSSRINYSEATAPTHRSHGQQMMSTNPLQPSRNGLPSKPSSPAGMIPIVQGGRTSGDQPMRMPQAPRINRDPGLNIFKLPNSKPREGLISGFLHAVGVPNSTSKGSNVGAGQGLSNLIPSSSTPKRAPSSQAMNNGSN
jgi:hypothetical protein